MSKNIEKQYLKLLKDILDNGVEKQTRNGETLSVFGRQIRHDMSKGFPLLTTKKIHWKSIVGELIWFLQGSTDIRDLWKNNIKIWDGDWYKNYQTSCSSPYSLEEIKEKIKSGGHSFHDSMFDLGPIYGKQWRSWKTNAISRRSTGTINEDGIVENMEFIEYSPIVIDQIQNLINDLKTNPDSRRLMVNAWNVNYLDEMTLPPCHYGFQVYTRELRLIERINIAIQKGLTTENAHMSEEDYWNWCDRKNIPTRSISLMWNQRSVDTFLGLPFNIASYGLLLEILAKEVNMVPDELIGNLGDTHLYLNHIEQAKEQLTREPMELPKLIINNEFWNPDDSMLSIEQVKHMKVDDFILDGYQSHPAIKAPLSN